EMWGWLPMLLAISIEYGLVAPSIISPWGGDDAYYYALARRIARTGRFDEPIVWHLLTLPEKAIHPAFDYWQPLPSLALVPSFLVFGDQIEVATWTMVFFSLLSIWLFALVLIRSRVIATQPFQIFALLAFTWSPAMPLFRFRVESPVFCQIAWLLTLLAFIKERFALAALFAFFAAFARTDSLLPILLIWLLLLLFSLRKVAWTRFWRKAPAWLPVVGVMFACFAFYVSIHLFRFGEPLPPGARLAPALSCIEELFEWNPMRKPLSPIGWLKARLDQATLSHAFEVLKGLLSGGAYVFRGEPLIEILGVGMVVVFLMLLTKRSFSIAEKVYTISVVMALCGSFLLALGAPAVFSPNRTLQSLVPFYVVASVGTIERLVFWLWKALERLRSNESTPSFSVDLTKVSCSLMFFLSLGRFESKIHLPPSYDTFAMKRIEELTSAMGSDVIATNFPLWLVPSGATAVLFPYQDDATRLMVLERYRPSWLLLHTPPHPIWGPRAVSGWVAYYDGQPHRLGPFRFEPCFKDSTFVIYRIEHDIN
ncbi:MAG: hypothetical protein NZM37_08630, partial [Sandaracinaceae bacterium]|nr:hypothetical protein [Sandaracinaceae bacterium]